MLAMVIQCQTIPFKSPTLISKTANIAGVLINSMQEHRKCSLDSLDSIDSLDSLDCVTPHYPPTTSQARLLYSKVSIWYS